MTSGEEDKDLVCEVTMSETENLIVPLRHVFVAKELGTGRYIGEFCLICRSGLSGISRKR